MRELTHLDLFSGIGGFALAARWAGIKTVQFVEIDPFCQKVLQKNFKGVPIHDDIKTFTYSGCERQKISEEQTTGIEQCSEVVANAEYIRCSETKKQRKNPRDQQKGEARENICDIQSSGNDCLWGYGRGDGRDVPKDHPFLLTGGFPCQPFSCAGKRRGKEDDRYLWEEMLRVIKEFKPTWIIGENVNGIRSMEFQDGVSELEGDTIIQEDGNGDYTNVLDGICDSLEAIGYEVQPVIIPACAVNAPHRRDRVWIAAHAESERSGRKPKEVCGEKCRQVYELLPNAFNTDCHAPDTSNKGLQRGEKAGNTSVDRKESRNELLGGCPGWEEPWLEVATRLCGIFNGLSEWMDRTGGLNGKTSIDITGQDLPHLWEGFQSESLQWSFGRFNTIPFKENLFTVLWKLFAESHRQDNLPFESKEVQDAFMRNMWIGELPGCPSQRWEYSEQYAREHSDALSQLSYEVALVTKEITEKYSDGRVNRLKALGNAVVPQIPYLIMKAILEVTP